jgi:hypothetical protein
MRNRFQDRLLNNRFLYRAWLLEDGMIVQCVCDTYYGDGDIEWELYNPNVEIKRFSIDVIGRDHARTLLNKPHVLSDHSGEVKVFLDDERTAPPNWVRAKHPDEVIALLKKWPVREISLDHDLGMEETGYDVLLWIEEQVIVNGFVPPKISIHTANPSARKKMEAAKKNIEKHS